MRVDIKSRPAYALAYVLLEAGESIYAEPGAMVLMSSGVGVNARAQGGVGRALMRKMLIQESFWLARYTAEAHNAWVALAPKYPGDIVDINLNNETMFLESGSFLAHSEGIQTSARMGNFQTFALKEGLTIIKAEGQGNLLVGSYGGIEPFDLQHNQELVVDAGHLVAWSSSVNLQIGPLSGVVSSALTQEFIVGKLTGPGRVYIQTRAEQQLRSWIQPRRRQNSPRKK